MDASQAGLLISVISAAVATISAVTAIFQKRRTWYVGAIATSRLAWADNIRHALADLIIDYYNGGQNVPARVDCIRLYLNPENKRHKPLVDLLDDMKGKKKKEQGVENEDNELDEVIAEAQKLLRINWWAVKIDAMLPYRMDRRRDSLIDKRAQQHKAERSSDDADTPKEVEDSSEEPVSAAPTTQ